MTTHTILRPNATYSFTPGARRISATYYGDVSDQSDTTYNTATAVGDSTVFGLNSLTLAANQRVKGCTLNIRNARDGAGGSTQDTTTQFVAWPNLHAANGTLTVKRASTALWNYVGPQASTPPGKTTEWLQADLNAMAIYTRYYPAHTGTVAYQRVYELWVDVEILTQATITSVTNTTVSQNVTPTIDWVFNDPDGAPQQAYEVKVFNSTTYSASSFDPSVSTADWTSGQVVSIGTEVIVGTPLLNGVTYKTYVRAAKLGPKIPNSSPYWWSPWLASSSYTVTFTPPATPVLSSPGVLLEESQVKVPLIVSAPINLLTYDNSAFETTIGNWTGTAGCTIARSTTQVLQGSGSLGITVTGSPATATCGSDVNVQPRVEGGTQYTALASFRANTTGRSCVVFITWYKLDNTTTISTSTSGTVTDNSTGWVQAAVTATAPNGAVYARVGVTITGGTGSEVHYVDQVDIHTGSSTVWGAGGYVNSQGGIQLERCEFVNDARGPAQNWFQRQCGGTGSDTRNVGQGFAWDIANSTVNWQWLDVALGRSGYISTSMLRWVIQNAVANQYVAIGRDYYGRTIYNPPAVAGQTHVFSIWAWVKTGTRNVHASMQFWDQNNSALATTTGSTVALSTTPKQLIVSGVAPANAVYGNGVVFDNDGTQSTSIYLSTAGFGLGTAALDGLEPMGVFPNWAPVQFTTDLNTLDASNLQYGYNTSQIETIPDFEYPPLRPVLYRAYISYMAQSGYVIRSANSNLLTAYGNAPTRTIIRSVTDNTIGCVVNRRKSLTSNISVDAQVFHPAGADAAPIQVRDWVSGEDATLELILASEAQMQRIRRLLDSNTILVVQWAQGGRSYIIVTSVTLTETLSTDLSYCDIDGQSNHLRYVVASLSYLETVSPNASYTVSV